MGLAGMKFSGSPRDQGKKKIILKKIIINTNNPNRSFKRN